MGRDIVERLGLIVGAGNDTVACDDDRTDRNLPFVESGLGFFQCQTHETLVFLFQTFFFHRYLLLCLQKYNILFEVWGKSPNFAIKFINAMAAHNELGTWGEDCAADFLKRQGYVILERDWRNGRSHRDIDIICLTPDRTTMVFVEVKSRTPEQLRDPEDAVDRKKIRRIGGAADEYVKMHDVTVALRFDIVAIVGQKDSPNPQINHIEDAFNPLLV